MTDPAARRPTGGSHFSEPPVWVRIGALNSEAVQQVGQVLQVLRQTAGSSRHRIVVDLTRLGSRNELTLFGLLVDAARQAATAGGELTVLSSPNRLAAELTRSQIPVVLLDQAPPKPSGTLVIDLGDLAAP